MIEKTLSGRITGFVIVFGLTLILVYGLLSWLTGSVDVLSRMSHALDESGINPSSYYYTDVEQVLEAEHYLGTALDVK